MPNKTARRKDLLDKIRVQVDKKRKDRKGKVIAAAMDLCSKNIDVVERAIYILGCVFEEIPPDHLEALLDEIPHLLSAMPSRAYPRIQYGKWVDDNHDAAATARFEPCAQTDLPQSDKWLFWFTFADLILEAHPKVEILLGRGAAPEMKVSLVDRTVSMAYLPDCSGEGYIAEGCLEGVKKGAPGYRTGFQWCPREPVSTLLRYVFDRLTKPLVLLVAAGHGGGHSHRCGALGLPQ